jgi:hypothetical protein
MSVKYEYFRSYTEARERKSQLNQMGVNVEISVGDFRFGKVDDTTVEVHTVLRYIEPEAAVKVKEDHRLNVSSTIGRINHVLGEEFGTNDNLEDKEDYLMSLFTFAGMEYAQYTDGSVEVCDRINQAIVTGMYMIEPHKDKHIIFCWNNTGESKC